MSGDNQEALLINNGALIQQHQLVKLNRAQFWLLVALNVAFLLVGQAAAIVLGRNYYDKGGNSKWLATFVQTAGFPVLVIPYFFISSPKQHSGEGSSPPSMITVSVVYFIIGAMIAGDNMLYSIGLLHLSGSTYSLICASQLAFTAVFSFFLNNQKFTALILNSVIVLSISAALLAVDDDSDTPFGVTKQIHAIGFVATLAASALYSLVLSLVQISFEKVLKKETFTIVLEMQIYTSIVATGVSAVGLFASGEWKTLPSEMSSFSSGTFAYVMNLLWTAIAWQMSSVGSVGLIFVISSLFSNVINTLSLSVTPIASVIVFHDKMNGGKIIAMILAIWGFISYIYQNYLDDVKARTELIDRDGESTRSP